MDAVEPEDAEKTLLGKSRQWVRTHRKKNEAAPKKTKEQEAFLTQNIGGTRNNEGRSRGQVARKVHPRDRERRHGAEGPRDKRHRREGGAPEGGR